MPAQDVPTTIAAAVKSSNEEGSNLALGEAGLASLCDVPKPYDSHDIHNYGLDANYDNNTTNFVHTHLTLVHDSPAHF